MSADIDWFVISMLRKKYERNPEALTLVKLIDRMEGRILMLEERDKVRSWCLGVVIVALVIGMFFKQHGG